MAHVISPTLTYLFNTSLLTGFVPHDWKLARVSPAYKGKGDTLDRTNYRPLSVVAHLAKALEREVKVQFIDYLTLHSFISIDQSAYLKGHGTHTCLHRLIDDI